MEAGEGSDESYGLVDDEFSDDRKESGLIVVKFKLRTTFNIVLGVVLIVRSSLLGANPSSSPDGILSESNERTEDGAGDNTCGGANPEGLGISGDANLDAGDDSVEDPNRGAYLLDKMLDRDGTNGGANLDVGEAGGGG